jgi:hypothetical protein
LDTPGTRWIRDIANDADNSGLSLVCQRVKRSKGAYVIAVGIDISIEDYFGHIYEREANNHLEFPISGAYLKRSFAPSTLRLCTLFLKLHCSLTEVFR